MTSRVGAGGRTAHHHAPPELDTGFMAFGACNTDLSLIPAEYRSDVMCADSGSDAKTARAICSRCDVEMECLAWAISVGQESCTHARIRFTPRFLNRYRRTISKLGSTEGTTVAIRTSAPTGVGPTGTVVAIPTPLAAAFVAAKLATLEPT